MSLHDTVTWARPVHRLPGFRLIKNQHPAAAPYALLCRPWLRYGSVPVRHSVDAAPCRHCSSGDDPRRCASDPITTASELQLQFLLNSHPIESGVSTTASLSSGANTWTAESPTYTPYEDAGEDDGRGRSLLHKVGCHGRRCAVPVRASPHAVFASSTPHSVIPPRLSREHPWG